MKKKILLVLALAGIAYLVIDWNQSADAIKQQCNVIQTGDSIQQLKGRIKNETSLKISVGEKDDKKFLLLYSAANYGRHTCLVEYRDGKVTRHEYSYLD